EFPQKLVTDYSGITLAAGRKAAVVLDLENWSSAARPAPDRHREAPGGPLVISTDDDRYMRSRLENLQKKRTATMQTAAKDRKIAILGGGNLGRALAMGWVESGYCSAERIWITRRNPEKLTFFADV